MLVSCNGCNRTAEMPAKVIEAPEYPVVLNRFEKELFEADSTQVNENLKRLYQKYGVFYTSYARDIMQMPEDPNDPMYLRTMNMLYHLHRMRELQQIIDSSFGDMGDIKKELSSAMGIYHKAFPKNTVPQFTTYISEFGTANIIFDSMICIGLDFYLNTRLIEFYRGLDFPEFRINKMQKVYIVPNAIKALAIGQFDHQTSKDKRFLAQILLEGKILYFMKSLMPQVADTVIMGYTQKQWQWCKENEVPIWTHFLDGNKLYGSEPGAFMRYLNDGPFTVAEGVPKESAPAIGSWIGWQIINQYMNNQPMVSLNELMYDTNFDKILKLSKYRPK